MLKLTKTGIGLLTRQYRSVLRKCWLINVGLWQAMGDAVSKAVSVPARLVASLLSGGALSGEAFNVLDEILLTRLFERKLATLTAIGLTIAAATMPGEANADFTGTGSLCYTSGGAVVFHDGTDCASGEARLAVIGTSASDAVPGAFSTALGFYAQATGDASTALGLAAQAIGSSSVALGSEAYAGGVLSVALGKGSKTLSTDGNAVSVGDATASTPLFRRIINVADGTGDHDAVTLGQLQNNYYTKSQVDSGDSDGPKYIKVKPIKTGGSADAIAYGERDIAIGASAVAGESGQINYATAIGTTAQATKVFSTALGHYALATGERSTAIGSGTQATGNYSTALGNIAYATGKRSTALGHEAHATSDYSTALGDQAQATQSNAVAIGYYAEATGLSSTTLGTWATATGLSSTALGSVAQATEDGVVSVGRNQAVPDNVIEQVWAATTHKVVQSLLKNYGYDATVARFIYNDIQAGELTHDQIIKKYKLDGYSRIINVADAINEHDAVTLGQLQNNYYKKLLKKDEILDESREIENISRFLLYFNRLRLT